MTSTIISQHADKTICESSNNLYQVNKVLFLFLNASKTKCMVLGSNRVIS